MYANIVIVIPWYQMNCWLLSTTITIIMIHRCDRLIRQRQRLFHIVSKLQTTFLQSWLSDVVADWSHGVVSCLKFMAVQGCISKVDWQSTIDADALLADKVVKSAFCCVLQVEFKCKVSILHTRLKMKWKEKQDLGYARFPPSPFEASQWW